MNRSALAALLALGLSFALQPRGSAQQANVQGSRGAVSVRATTISELRTWDTFVTEGSRSSALRLRSEQRDPALPARTVERFDQFHDGVKIWGADIVRDSEQGVPHSIFGQLSPALTLSVEPSLIASAAREALLLVGGTESLLLTEPELVILRLDDGDHRLTYTAVVSGGADVVRAFIDAQTGAELMRYSEIQTQQAMVGTGTGVLGDQKKLSVESSAGAYIAFDRHRPPIIETFDMRGDLARAIRFTLTSSLLERSDLASDSDNIWSDVAVVDAHVHVGWTYDYYYKRFGRSGFDDRDSPINIVTNGLSQEGALDSSLPSWVHNLYVRNAWWCGGCNGGVGVMYFGNGIPAGYYYQSSGERWTYVSGALDVAAHELTHAVTQATSGLIYRNESGALNEAFSDIMGKSVEFFYHPPGSGAGQADYVIGKDVVRGVMAGVANGIRSMANPGLYGHPDHYSRRYTGTDDGGGVHINSGIANQAFYLAVEGGTNRTSGVTVQGVGAANREQIEQVYYRAFTLLMPANSTFSTARAATVQAAQELYGADGTVERAVTEAWTAVGVLEFDQPTLNISFSPSPAIAHTTPSALPIEPPPAIGSEGIVDQPIPDDGGARQ
jgi:thermolysin